MIQEQTNTFDSQSALHRKELLRSQQGELDAVLMYQRLAKLAKTSKERDALSVKNDEHRHGNILSGLI